MFSLETKVWDDDITHGDLVLTDFWSKLIKLSPGTPIVSHQFDVGQSKFQFVVYPSGRCELDKLAIFLVNCNNWQVTLSSRIEPVGKIKQRTRRGGEWKRRTMEKSSDSLLYSIKNMGHASIPDVDQVKISVKLELNSVTHEGVPVNFDKEDSLEKFTFTPLIKCLESESAPAKDAEIDSKLDAISSNVSQINDWMVTIKDSVDKLVSEVVMIKEKIESKSKEFLPTGKECCTQETNFEEDCVEGLNGQQDGNDRPTLKEKMDVLRKVCHKIDEDVDNYTVEMKSPSDDFEAKMIELPSEVIHSGGKVIGRLEKLPSDLASNGSLLVEGKDRIAESYDLEALRMDLEANRYEQRKDFDMIRDDVQANTKGLRKLYTKIDNAYNCTVEMKSQLDNFEAKLIEVPSIVIKSEIKVIDRLEHTLSKEITGLSENLSKNQRDNLYNSHEGFKWIWGKVDNDYQSLNKLVEDQVEAQTLVLLDTFSQKSAKGLAAPECPYCMEDFRPPGRIFQCFTGHLICEECLANPSFRDCPTCSQKIIGRNRGLESFLESAQSLLTGTE
eukprot:GFUD01120352.1.p1 GENE.GFUD01120352.1~~GFUD01120352.1.p1  ORF type:complete len:557 (+),score=120.11 GFUD01120352.1:86-1756(+)